MDNFMLWLLKPVATKVMDIAILLGTLTILIAVVLLVAIILIKFVKPKIRRSNSISGDITQIEFNEDHSYQPEHKIEAKSNERKSLLNHHFFKYMDNILTPGYLTLNAEGKKETNKDAVNLVFLRDCKFRVFRDGIKDFVEDVEKHNGENLYKLPNVITDLINQYEGVSQTVKIVLPDGQVIYGVPSCYVNKFNNWNSEHLQICLDGINNALSDSLYNDDWFIILSVCLERLTIIFELTIEDAKRTLGQLNGDLEKEIGQKVSASKGN